MSLSISQQQALAILPKVTGALSMLGSGIIIHQILSSHEKRGITYHRLLLGMSVSDILSSFWLGLSTWPVPAGTPGVWAAVGNTATCSAQGFFVQLTIATPMYNASLAIYYLLVATCRWNEDRVRPMEKYMHAIPILFALVSATIGLPLDLYNNANLWCWIAPLPLDCTDSSRYGGSTTTEGGGGDCDRGDNAWIYRWALFYAPLWSCILVATVSMFLVYLTVLRNERAVDQYQTSGVGHLRKQSHRVATQAFWYIVAFYASWIFATVKRLLQTIPRTQHYDLYPITLLMAAFTPLQGFLNFCVYTRSRFIKYRRENPDRSIPYVLRRAAFSSSDKKRSSGKSRVNHNNGQGNLPEVIDPQHKKEMLRSHQKELQGRPYAGSYACPLSESQLRVIREEKEEVLERTHSSAEDAPPLVTRSSSQDGEAENDTNDSNTGASTQVEHVPQGMGGLGGGGVSPLSIQTPLHCVCLGEEDEMEGTSCVDDDVGRRRRCAAMDDDWDPNSGGSDEEEVLSRQTKDIECCEPPKILPRDSFVCVDDGPTETRSVSGGESIIGTKQTLLACELEEDQEGAVEEHSTCRMHENTNSDQA